MLHNIINHVPFLKTINLSLPFVSAFFSFALMPDYKYNFSVFCFLEVHLPFCHSLIFKILLILISCAYVKIFKLLVYFTFYSCSYINMVMIF